MPTFWLLSPTQPTRFSTASGTETSLRQLAEMLARVMGSDCSLYMGRAKVNPVRRRLASVEKAKELLGFSARISLEEGLHRLVDWWHEER